MEDSNNKLKGLIEKGSEIGGSVTGAAIGLVVAGPLGALGGAAVGPIIAALFNKVGTGISERLLNDREQIRVGATFSLAYDKIENEVQNKQNALRTDSFIQSQDGFRSGAEMILEGTLLKARNEYEEKKIKYYANYLANINLDSSISFEKGNTILRIIERLSYRQIVILAYFEKIEFLSIEKWMISFSTKKELGEYQDFYSELIDLYNQQLLQQAGNGIAMSIGSLKLSPFGRTLCNLLEVSDVDKQDEELISKTIIEINKFIS